MEAEQFSNIVPEDDDAAKAEADEAGDAVAGAGDTANGEPEFSNAPPSSTAEFSNEAASEEAEQSQSPPRPPTGTVMGIPAAAGPPPSETVASLPGKPPMSTIASEPADTTLEESSGAPAEASPSSAEEPSAPAPAQPPPMCTVAARPSTAAPEAARADAKTENGDGKKWEVADMSYIQNRTKDVNNFEARRNTSDEPAGLIPGAASVKQGSKDADGKWQTVGTEYIDHRTNDPNRLEIRRTTGDVGSAGAIKDAGQQGSASVKKEGDGKWTVDVSYINHRTGDTANLDRTFEKTDTVVYADPAETKYPYEEISGSDRPKDVDPTQKEAYLSDTEFQTVFGMDVATFAKQPKWKQKNMKKAKELF